VLQHGEIVFDRATSETSVQELTDLVVAEYRAGRAARKAQESPMASSKPGPSD
jgi:hypothetical protein